MDTSRFPVIVRQIYELVRELERMFPGRHFTPDGHMVGSLGEAWAAHRFGIQLEHAAHEQHDGRIGDEWVQIKTTQRDRISISSKPDYLLALRLDKDGSFSVIYNGPGDPVWALVSGKPLPKTGQYQISLSRLRALAKDQEGGSKFLVLNY